MCRYVIKIERSVLMQHNKTDLKQMQSLPLEEKIIMTKERIKVWYESWKKFEIHDKDTGEIRFVTADMRLGKDEPKLKDTEYIDKVFDGQVYVSFSGGKDSTVLLHMVRDMYPDVEAVFVNTGLEYPEIQQFVKSFSNVTILRPKMRFDEVIKKYGYPMISKEVSNTIYGAKNNIKEKQYSLRLAKLGILDTEYGGLQNDGKYHYHETIKGSKFTCRKYRQLIDLDANFSDICCNIMKKEPFAQYEKQTHKKPFMATMTTESMLREKNWLKMGCNAFESKKPKSAPMSFWTEQDILQYIKTRNLSICSVYGDVIYAEDFGQTHIEEYTKYSPDKLITTGCDRTGCIFCGFGCHLDKAPSRFQRLKETHPRQYQYCLDGGEHDESGVWKPNKQGLGMKHIFDELNMIYGCDFIKYE